MGSLPVLFSDSRLFIVHNQFIPHILAEKLQHFDSILTLADSKETSGCFEDLKVNRSTLSVRAGPSPTEFCSAVSG